MRTLCIPKKPHSDARHRDVEASADTFAYSPLPAESSRTLPPSMPIRLIGNAAHNANADNPQAVNHEIEAFLHKIAADRTSPAKNAQPYPRDRTKPYGSKENPVVVGIPEHSTTLIHDGKNNRWILTDGLGNGWIR